MQPEYAAPVTPDKPNPRVISDQLSSRLTQFLSPLLVALDERIDARLVETFLRLVAAILTFRHRNQGLLLSELGGYLLDPEHSPAGTKRVSNLLACPKWRHGAITAFLAQLGRTRLAELEARAQPALAVWDESVLEKPESRKVEGLGSVRSSRGARLQRIKPGFFRRPGPPILVPGHNWLSVALLGMSGPPVTAVMRWWTNRLSGNVPVKSLRQIRGAVLRWSAREWGRRVLHVWDRGYCGRDWLGQAFAADVRFVMRWRQDYKLLAGERTANASQLTRYRRAQDEQQLWDPQRHEFRTVRVLSQEVRHPDYPDQPLWLVVARLAGRHQTWYLLTNEPADSLDVVWRLFRAYVRRWQIELVFRACKHEFAFESPRLWTWERRLKLLLLATLAYLFVLSLCPEERQEPLIAALLRQFCHRTGKHCQEALLPLCRVRAALSRLWVSQAFPDFRYHAWLAQPSESPG